MGADLDAVCDALDHSLSAVAYKHTMIRLSSELRTIDRFAGLPSTPLELYYEKHITAGDELCQETGLAHAMAQLGVVAIRRERSQVTGDPNKAADSHAYIIRSLKRKEEVELLRSIYQDRFFLIAAYSPRDARLATLSRRIADSHHDHQSDAHRSHAESLLYKDEFELQQFSGFGQNVRDTFPLADVFIDSSKTNAAASQISRFIELLFGHPFHTPTISEYGMFLAHGAARRSADLSRQVGAALMNKAGSVLALGCNEVPKPGGGAYWPHDANDNRDFVLGEDASYRHREHLLGDALRRLQGAGWLAPTQSERDVSDLVQEALQRDGGFLRDSQLMDVIEFGRTVHAEMMAITDAALRGVSTEDAWLYSTTFPCHNCARHILSAGIKSVSYIEPYPKSLAGRLFPESIAIEPIEPGRERLAFTPFIGIGPRIYSSLFSAGKRKADDGKKLTFSPPAASPKTVITESSYLTISEALAADTFYDALRDSRLLQEKLDG